MAESTPAFVIVYHPTLPDVTREVAKADLERWVAAGWLKTGPKASE